MGTSAGDFVEKENLNGIGDLLAGVFAPLAFVGLIATIFIQARELANQQKELRETRLIQEKQTETAILQSKLAIASTRANYQLALHDKRMKLYSALKECMSEFNIEGTVNSSIAMKLRDAAEAARFVFGDEVTDWTNELASSALKVFLKGRAIERLGDKLRGSGLTAEEEKRRLSLIDEVGKIEDEIIEMLSPAELDQMLLPYLKVPHVIEIEGETSKLSNP